MTADLIRRLKVPFTLDYITASSYGRNGLNPGELVIRGMETLLIEDQEILIMDDILDTGATMKGVVERFKERNPKSLKTLVLLVRKANRAVAYRPDYVLFDIDDHFVVGYGLDYKEHFRGLPGIYHFKGDVPPAHL